MSEQAALPTLGFIGTGALTTALVTGFCERAADCPYPIVVSPRSQDNAARLSAAYPGRVTVAASIQEVADRSDWVMLAVLPQQGEAVCRALRLRPEHKVVNFLTDKTLPQIRDWIGETAVLVHMVPLTFNAFCQGPIVLSPPQAQAAEIFGHIGEIIQVEQRYQAAVLAAITGCVTPFYTLLDTLAGWARDQGVPGALAASYVTSFFQAICAQAVTLDQEQLGEMARVSTPGGINYMANDLLRQAGGFKPWEDAMDAVLKRLSADIPR